MLQDNYGKLLLSALPIAELRRMGRGVGCEGGKQRGKGGLVEKLCLAASKQRLLQSTEMPVEAGNCPCRFILDLQQCTWINCRLQASDIDVA